MDRKIVPPRRASYLYYCGLEDHIDALAARLLGDTVVDNSLICLNPCSTPAGQNPASPTGKPSPPIALGQAAFGD